MADTIAQTLAEIAARKTSYEWGRGDGYQQAHDEIIEQARAALREQRLGAQPPAVAMPGREEIAQAISDATGRMNRNIYKAADAVLTLLRPPSGATSSPPHPDDVAVDRFAAAMKAKLAKKRAEGRGGWDDKFDCSNETLSRLLRGHVEKGDPLDVGNLAMMIHQRDEIIGSPPPVNGPLPQAEPVALQATREDERLACWKIAENERATAPADKQAWLVAFDIANAIKSRGFALPRQEGGGK